mmetsp:Transcript_22762/g.58045  ORF Transcript_22762/g.58045 Transcript_22762/m.58045 type:complete len:258 (-) Transcript_22762:52-825(-)
MHGGRIGVELLAQRHRHGVLQLRPPHLHDGTELAALGEEGLAELLDGLHQRVVHQDQRDLRRGRVRIVGGLTLVDVIVGMAELVLALLLAQVLQRTVGNHLVGIHVGGGAGAALYHVHQEVVAHLCARVVAQDCALGVDELVARVADGLGLVLGHVPELVVRHGARLLHLGKRDDELREVAEQDPRDVVILDRPQRLDTEVGRGGHLPLAKQVLLLPHPLAPVDYLLPHRVGHEGPVHRAGARAHGGWWLLGERESP